MLIKHNFKNNTYKNRAIKEETGDGNLQKNKKPRAKKTHKNAYGNTRSSGI